jgi:hypothetical protein
MKDSTFKTGLVCNVLSVFLVASTALAAQSVAPAADANNQPPKDTLHQGSATLNRAENYESSSWDRNLQFDRFDGARLVQSQFVPAPFCYTFAGPVCSMMVALPAGSPCTCPNPYGPGVLPGRTGF